jgi:hypothetical protein
MSTAWAADLTSAAAIALMLHPALLRPGREDAIR